MIFIETKEIVKDFSAHRALDHVSIEVQQGRVYGLLGPNGAGKTTLIRILNRIGISDSGEVLFKGRKMVQEDTQNIGYLPEERGLFRKMKVGEQAIYLARLKGLSRQDAVKKLTEWFEKFDIMPWWNRKVEELSKGMQQKVQFVATVLHEPELLIFDEPFSGFDPVNAKLLKDEILGFKDKGHTIIFSTHNMQSVEEVCDDMGLINKSRLVLQGSVSEIKQRFKGSKYGISYYANNGFEIPSSLKERYGVSMHHNERAGFWEVEVLNPNQASVNEIIADFVPLGELVKFEEIIPSIQDIFIDTVTKTEPVAVEA
ncbi:ABC transporter ATP-binding protein [Porphyromonas canoris]|uniref:ABC transporter ATP-binding protein n=1 Tax=Porphyromonas canoris TaxID=36875 RepID=A0ABR4XLR8_9PORP|nr:MULTISPECIES: ATP-binding cassette domain-containing protein [Porphyromonas]KGL51846.1 ABC transporter ATP-binding protein [Porphyromonas canoris]KGN92707.1 ABC transporter ATP-binding protein [Porphyromonas canoris]KGN94726.1 ABC transporter ATP-binding protein [Porphyromonas sp. COT-108 OH2963]